MFISNVVNGKLTFDTKKFIAEETYRELMSRCPIEVNDIVYTTVGSYGNAALVETGKPFAFQRHIAHIKPNPEKVVPEFLLGMLQSPFVKRQADAQARGVAQKTLNLSELKNFLVYLPPFKHQLEYVAMRRKIMDIKTVKETSLIKFERLSASLQARSFNDVAADNAEIQHYV